MDVAIELPTQPKVQGQRWANTKTILCEQTGGGERIALHGLGKLDVLMALLIHLSSDGDAGNPSSQERVEIERIVDVVPSGVDTRQRISEDVIDRIGCHYPEVVLRHSSGAERV